MMVLDVGCGDRKTEGALGIDIVALPGVDIIHDLNVYPWPFKDGSFDKVLMLNIIEHLDDTIKAMREVHRILKPGGVVHIETCYWNYKHAFSDPTHKRFFTETTWDFFTGKRKSYYMEFVFNPVSFVWQYDYHLKYIPKSLKRFLGIFLCNVIEGMVVEMSKPMKRKCEDCRYAEQMALNPGSDRMLCREHHVDVLRTHVCGDFKGVRHGAD